MIETLSSIIGYGAVVMNLVLFLSSNRQTICIIKAVIEIFWATSYFLIGKFTIAILALVALIRQCVFFFRGKKAWAQSPIWLIVFLACALISPLIELFSIGRENLNALLVLTNLLPVVGSLFYVFAYYSTRAIITKILAFPGVVLYLTYVILISNVAGIVGNTLSLISVAIGLVRELIKIKKSPIERAKE